jgi:putative chitinase
MPMSGTKGQVTASLLRSLGVEAAAAERWAPIIATALAKHAIGGIRPVAAFLANAVHETGHLARLEENLNYRAEVLVPKFGAARIDAATALKIGRVDGKQKANQEAIANAIYGGAWGLKNLGNAEPGDGWKYRGRGLLQLTGKANYQRLSKAISRPIEELLVELLQPGPAADSAAHFFAVTGCIPLAEAGKLDAVRITINGGTNGIEEVRGLHATALDALGG